MPGSERDAVRSAGAHAVAGHEGPTGSGDQQRLRFSKFLGIRKPIAFGAIYTVLAVSVSIAGFSVVRRGHDAEPTTARVQSDISSRTEAVATSVPAPGRSEAVVEPQKSQNSRPAEPDFSSSRDIAKARGGSSGNGFCGPARGGGPTTLECRRGGCASAIDGPGDSATGPGTRAHRVGRPIPISNSERIGRNSAAFGRGTATGSYTQGRGRSDRHCANQKRVSCVAFTSARRRKTQSKYSAPRCWIEAIYRRRTPETHP